VPHECKGGIGWFMTVPGAAAAPGPALKDKDVFDTISLIALAVLPPIPLRTLDVSLSSAVAGIHLPKFGTHES